MMMRMQLAAASANAFCRFGCVCVWLGCHPELCCVLCAMAGMINCGQNMNTSVLGGCVGQLKAEWTQNCHLI